VKMISQTSQLTMILGMWEPLQLSRSLLSQSGLTHRDKPILPPLIGLLQSLLLLADTCTSGQGGHMHKRPPPAPKRKHALSSTDQVMTQIELPSYHGPRSPLDLVAIEIIFGHLFEAF
jgi:hypothetical protein